MSDSANEILHSSAFSAAIEETNINLVTISLADLGFEEAATYEEISKRAMEFGLQLCSAEVAPQLCLQYPDQPKGERLRIAREPMPNRTGAIAFSSLSTTVAAAGSALAMGIRQAAGKYGK